MEDEGLDAVIITTSGCGTTIKDYGFMLREDPHYAEKAQKISEIAKDITEFLIEQDLGEPQLPEELTVAYHSACSMQHGQQITWQPKKTAAERRLHCQRAAGRSPLLRLGWHLQHHAAQHRNRSTRPQSRQSGGHKARPRRHRQHRLHHSNLGRHPTPDHPQHRTPRLGLRRPKTSTAELGLNKPPKAIPDQLNRLHIAAGYGSEAYGGTGSRPFELSKYVAKYDELELPGSFKTLAYCFKFLSRTKELKVDLTFRDMAVAQFPNDLCHEGGRTAEVIVCIKTANHRFK